MLGRKWRIALTWPVAEEAESYRFLLRDVGPDEITLKVECPRPHYTLDARQLRDGHQYEWRVQVRKDQFEDWSYHTPYFRLFRLDEALSVTELEWESSGAPAYRVLINDRLDDQTLIKDAVLGTTYPVDWRRLRPEHPHEYAVQALIPGPEEVWQTIHDYATLPAPPAEVIAALASERPAVIDEPAPEPARPAGQELLFLWTCDTEVNMRYMEDPHPAEGVDHQIFGTDGRDEFGIRFMMELLEEFNVRGTFFLDILMEHQFGRAETERVIEAILSRGHDVQLHLHPSPNLLLSADRRLARFAPGLTRDDRDLFRGAMDLAVDLFVKRTGYEPVAYRSGAYHVCDSYLEVLPEFGIKIDTSIYPFKNCRVSDWMKTRSQPFWVGDVLEVPVSWMARLNRGQDHVEVTHEQLAPVASGTRQDAFSSFVPVENATGPLTFVYLAHSFSFLSTRRGEDPAGIRAWNARYKAVIGEELFGGVEMGLDNERIWMDVKPETNRIAIMTRLLHGLAARTDVNPTTFRHLYEGGLDRWRGPRAAPVDIVPAWDERSRAPGQVPLQVYSRDLLGSLASGSARR